MSDLLTALNHLLAGLLSGDAARHGAVTLASVRLHESGAQVSGHVHHALADGAFEITVRVDPERDGRQAVRVQAVRLPEYLAPALEPFRTMLMRSELRLDLDVQAARETGGPHPDD